MLVTRGQGNVSLLPTAGFGTFSGAQVVRNQWIRAWAIEQILARQAREEKEKLEEKLRGLRKKTRKSKSKVSPVAPVKRPRPISESVDLIAEARAEELAADARATHAEMRAIRARLAELEGLVREAEAVAISAFDLEKITKLQTRPDVKNHVLVEIKRRSEEARAVFNERAAAIARRRKNEQDALAVLFILTAA